MVKIEHNIIQINAENFSNLDYISEKDENLLEPVEVLNTFAPNDNFVELTYFSLNGERLSSIENYTNYAVLTGDTINNKEGTKEISIDVLRDFKQYNPETSEVVALYNFLDYSYSTTNTTEDFYIESISPDRTELRLVSVNLQPDKVLNYTNTLIESKNNSPYALELFLYEGNNTFYSLINIDIEVFRNTFGVLVKLLEPLPQNIEIKSRLNVVEKISEPIAYRVITKVIQEQEKTPTLRGANFDIEIETQSTEPSEYYNYNELFSFPTNNTNRELNSLFSEKGAELSIDYLNYGNFINFSSAEERVLNFKYKLDLIESYQTNLDSIITTSGVYSSTGITGSKVYYETLINGVIDNFDHYERHVYYESGSSSWPKSNTIKPFTNKASSDPESITWYNNQKQIANLYDAQNPDILTNTTPAFIKEDSTNEPYNLFINMVGQHFDNIWIYTNALSEKYNADNRLNRGAPKDLVEELLKNFGVKLYTSNRSATDLYRYFTVNSYDLDGEILTEGIISGSDNTPVSQDVYQKEVYKRLYHNLPLLMKSKGTERGLRALITCFGIPSDILKIKVYGGQSVNDLPFFGGEQEFTSSLDKVRINNTGSIVEGNTLSFYTTINNKDNNITQDLHRIEVGFSPTDNIDSYINKQLAQIFPSLDFNIDNYIGDPRDTTTNSYPDLNTYRDAILSGLDRYDIKDFIRLIKFFDNNIFRMVRDFIPARVVADTGVIIKQHLLERNKTISPVLSWTLPEYTGSIDTAFITGSTGGAFESIATGSLNGESQTKYALRVQTPLGVRIKDWEKEGEILYVAKSQEEAKYDGELSGSNIRVTDGELNRTNPFKKITYPIIKYNVQFYTDVPTNLCVISSPANPLLYDPLSDGVVSLSNYFEAAGSFEYDIDYSQGSFTGSPFSETITQPGEFDFATLFISITDQYKIVDLEATNTILGGTCTETSTLKFVACDIATSTALPITINGYESYDLTSWFDSQYNLSPNIEFLVTGSVVNSGDVTGKVFGTGYTDGEAITVSMRDINDPTRCIVNTTVNYTDCPLFHGGVSNLEVEPTDGTGTFYKEPYGFNGVISGLTSYEIRVKNKTDNTFGTWVNVVGEVYTSPDILYSNGYSSAFPIFTTFPSTDTFEIQFRATISAGCTDDSNFIKLTGAASTSYVAKSLSYSDFNQASVVCSNILNNQTITVYVNSTYNNDSPYTIINDGNAKIYSDSNGNSIAASGLYGAYDTSGTVRLYKPWDSSSESWDNVTGLTDCDASE